MDLHNYMEILVERETDNIIEELGMCTCELCKYDIMARALNDLPPKYIVSEKGELYTKINNLQQQFEVDVLTSVTKAAILVKRNPRHE